MPGMALLKPLLKYATTIDFGRLTMVRQERCVYVCVCACVCVCVRVCNLSFTNLLYKLSLPYVHNFFSSPSSSLLFSLDPNESLSEPRWRRCGVW